MTNSSLTALSGLQANQSRQAASAHNIANQTTDGFAKQRVTQSDQTSGGVQHQVDVVDLSAQAKQISQSIEGSQNNVDVAEEMVTQIESKSGYQQNAQVVSTQDQMTKTLLDTFA